MEFHNRSPKNILAYAIGAALYMPATRSEVAEEIKNGKHEGLTTVILDLEDAIGDQQVGQAEESLAQQLLQLLSYVRTGMMSEQQLPLLFVRVRSVEQLERLLNSLGETLALLTGFVLPKFSSDNGRAYFALIAEYNRTMHTGAGDASRTPVLYGLPILESSKIIYRETRWKELLAIKEILDEVQEYVLNVRIGATDFSSLYGLRRSPDITIYEIAVIRDCIADIINLFGRVDSDYVVSGPVWEYFSHRERIFKPQLRVSPFEDAFGKPGRYLRMDFISDAVDGLIREVMMDKENGIIGKTIIHPSHIKPVQAMYAVTHEEYMDALEIVERNDGSLGVFKSTYANKMNEIKPHLNWAYRIINRSKVYGVLHEQQHFVSLLPNHENTSAANSGAVQR
ncbi:HpcH/HpaI aldolase/citrate lyase family protein [Paenibacillus polymyxa]|jgi:citrate lyase beta subunit|uniref:HpcH/HpaI aldolase/citrate lyase family protein n=1 Tax=Paenibacillus TaxID=44249 RepID=UPI000D30A199|nr:MULTISPECIES: HpcH/HpaI aldolase/citrate lyase family protein [Paenibacillus]KAF6618554.1 HpcH/HpaI aldolase/citrate lyase family protein [Paenibacillus sp. EKM101P]KAF6624900.1 HpcH/HpaI aldolase/citrate lyase family protein [Paenibacillus sp. EKM102P]KAF6635320.1 HpcH/HpaI aldolase/citrate lyase family protein [Paenibacillus sp. EKM10P]KAF6648970.1 HpcH/HpaI aldolase/citrate lyase family protein [Paenibacillus sp. EKM11P]MBY0021039.1 HpcH/HpaI aldolase/citrate lyase family protein [Paenib